MNKVKCLAFLDNPLGRDTEILLPISFVLEEYYKVDLTYLFIWDLLLIRKLQPDLILLPNLRGHPMYVEIAAYARAHDVVVFALDSEGNFRIDETYDYWGYNTKKILFQDWICCWSDRITSYLKKLIPEAADKIVTTGGTSFDRYTYSNFPSREKVLHQLNKTTYKRVIGYAGWAFARLYGKEINNSFRRFFPENRAYALKWIEEQRVFVRETLRHLIQQNPDTLFILKKHPKENLEDEPNEGKNEMNELIDYDNVVYLKNEIAVELLIHSSDIWMGFETTTLLEAWLLGKPTILINQITDFPRTEHYRGALIASDKEEAQNLINVLYDNKNIADSYDSKKAQYQRKLIQNAIGFADGFNHLRACYYLAKVLPTSHRIRKFRLSARHLRLYILMHYLRFFYNKNIFLKIPKLSKTVYVFENRNLPGFQKRKTEAYRDLRQFHAKYGIDKLLHSKDWQKVLKKLNKR
jgi:surface carbohydrate biosynthesis protein